MAEGGDPRLVPYSPEDEAKQRIETKIKQLREEKEKMSRLISNCVDEVITTATSCLSLERSAFFDTFRGTNERLEYWLDGLLLMRANLHTYRQEDSEAGLFEDDFKCHDTVSNFVKAEKEQPILPHVEEKSLQKVSELNRKEVHPQETERAPSASCQRSTVGGSNAYSASIDPPQVPKGPSFSGVVCFIVSPSEFYVHVTDSEGKPPNDVELLQDTMNIHYQSLPSDSEHRSFPNNFSQLKGTFWACKYSQDQRWYRAKALRVIIRTRMVRVQYIDYGNYEDVKIQDLKWLEPNMQILPAVAVRCSLAHVQPSHGCEWKEDLNAYFSRASGYNDKDVVKLEVLNRSATCAWESTLQVILFNANHRKTSVNELLAKRASGSSISIYGTEEDRLREERQEVTGDEAQSKINAANAGNVLFGRFFDSLPSGTKKYAAPAPIGVDPAPNDGDLDDTSEDGRNGYDDDDQDIGMAINGYRTTQEQMVCRYYGTRKGCHEGVFCVFKHIDPMKMNKDAVDDEVIYAPLPGDDLDLGLVTIIKVTEVKGSQSFHGVLPFGTLPIEKIPSKSLNDYLEKFAFGPELNKYRDLRREMKEHYSKHSSRENTNVFPALSSLVAVQEKESEYFFRGRVIDMNYEQASCTVQCVDTGRCVVTLRKFIFKLMPRFSKWPELAVHFGINCSHAEDVLKEVHLHEDLPVLGNSYAARIIDSDIGGRTIVDLLDLNGECQAIQTRLSKEKLDHQGVGSTSMLSLHNTSSLSENDNLTVPFPQKEQEDAEELFFSDSSTK